jgi:hypothetical protein
MIAFAADELEATRLGDAPRGDVVDRAAETGLAQPELVCSPLEHRLEGARRSRRRRSSGTTTGPLPEVHRRDLARRSPARRGHECETELAQTKGTTRMRLAGRSCDTGDALDCRASASGEVRLHSQHSDPAAHLLPDSARQGERRGRGGCGDHPDLGSSIARVGVVRCP